MSEKAARHEAAAARHEQAAVNHDRAARFWEDRGDRERAGLQREMAEYERHGARLERRWGDLVERNGADRAVHEARDTIALIHEGAQRLSSRLSETATALEMSAVLAGEHAQRREEAGRSDDAAEERHAADRARAAARRARSQAEEWLKVIEHRKP